MEKQERISCLPLFALHVKHAMTTRPSFAPKSISCRLAIACNSSDMAHHLMKYELVSDHLPIPWTHWHPNHHLHHEVLSRIVQPEMEEALRSEADRPSSIKMPSIQEIGENTKSSPHFPQSNDVPRYKGFTFSTIGDLSC